MKKNECQGFILRHRRLVCENSKFDVYLDHIEGERGQVIPDYLVVAPKNSTGELITGVAVLPIMDRRIGLIRIYRHAIRECSWEIPRGFIDAGESPAMSAARELEEETGLGCKLEGMRSFGYVTPEAGILQARIHLFGAFDCFRLKAFHAEEFGHRELQFFSEPEVVRMAMDSKIQDPCTLVALYRMDHL